jgi:putative membrane protein
MARKHMHTAARMTGFSTDAAEATHRAVLIGALAVPAASLLGLTAPSFGPLSLHMVVHIACMNVVAPLTALALSRVETAAVRVWSTPSLLWLATLLQLAILWASHSPYLHHAQQAAPLAAIALHAVLFCVALIFWLSILGASSRPWQAMLALLISGKFACLLGALLTFAPRPLFTTHAGHRGDAALLADQHLAGLVMIAACPLSYVLTAVVLAVYTVNGLDKSVHSAPPATAER